MSKALINLKEIIKIDGTVKISYSDKDILMSHAGQNHANTIGNYNLKRKQMGLKPIPFDEWVRIIIDNEEKRVWVRIADIDPIKSYEKQKFTFEVLGLQKLPYKIKFNCSQSELKQNYGLI